MALLHSSLHQTFLLVSSVWDSQRLVLLVKTEAKKALSSSAFSMSFVTSSLALFSSRSPCLPQFLFCCLCICRIISYCPSHPLTDPFLIGLGFANPIPAQTGCSSILLLDHLPLLPLLVDFISMSVFS